MLHEYCPSPIVPKNLGREKPTIKLIGDTSENITELVDGLGCTCGLQNEIRNILEIYANKIHKLRDQRDQLIKRYQTMAQTQPQISKSLTLPPSTQTTQRIVRNNKQEGSRKHLEELEPRNNRQQTNKKTEQQFGLKDTLAPRKSMSVNNDHTGDTGGDHSSNFNIFELLYNNHSQKNAYYDDEIVELSESEIANPRNSHDESDSMLLTLNSCENRNQEESSFKKKNALQPSLKQSKNNTPAHVTPAKCSANNSVKVTPKPTRTFQEFLQDKACQKLSACKYAEDAKQLYGQKLQRKNHQLTNEMISSRCNQLESSYKMNKKNNLRGRQVSEFRLPLKQWKHSTPNFQN